MEQSSGVVECKRCADKGFDVKLLNACSKTKKTSTEIGHNLIPDAGLQKQVLTLKVPDELKTLSVPLKEARQDTTNNLTHCWLYNENDPVNKASRVSGTRLLYIKPFAEVVKLSPPNPHRAPLSEYQDRYPSFQVHPPNSRVVDLYPSVFCKIQNACKDQQPPLKTDSEGFSKHLDIYTSTSHFDYHLFHPQEVDQYKSKPFTYDTQLSQRIKPVYDVLVFHNKYEEKILPKVIRHVPHSGLESEMKGKYQIPRDEMPRLKHRILMPPITRINKAEILATSPAIYHTEYNKIGTI